MKRDFLGLAAAILLVVGGGCATDPTDSLNEGIGWISTSVSHVDVRVGDSVVVTAETRNNQGASVTELPVPASLSPAVASVADAYLPPVQQARFYIKALTYGEGMVTVSAGGKADTITVQTLPATVEISGAPDTLGSGATAQLVAAPLDVAGNPVTMDASLFTWSADPASVVSVDEVTGLATAQAPGTAVITVEGPGVTGDLPVVVVAGVFAGTLSATSGAPAGLITATKAAAGPAFDSDSKAALNGLPAWVDAFTANTLTFAVPATGSTAAGVLTLSDMGPNQLAQNTAFTPTSTSDVWSPGNISDDCTLPASPVNYNTQKSASGWVYFSHSGSSQGGRGCWNGPTGFDHYFTYTTGGTAETVEVRTEWTLSGDNDLYVCVADLSDNCDVAGGFSSEDFNEIIGSVSLAANTTYVIIFSPWTAAGGGNLVRLKIQ